MSGPMVFNNNIGRGFCVRAVSKGEKYGLNDSLTHDSDDQLIEFYDTRYQHTRFGQFISRYFKSTLMEHRSMTMNLDQDACREWYLDSLSLLIVRQWLRTLP